MVLARSYALIPVVTPNFGWASTAIVNAVPFGSVFRSAIGGKSSRSARSGVIATQMSPRAFLSMKLTCSGVTILAAMTMSPSFSRSSSSATMIILP